MGYHHDHTKTLNLRYFYNTWSKSGNLLQNKCEIMERKFQKDVILGYIGHHLLLSTLCRPHIFSRLMSQDEES